MQRFVLCACISFVDRKGTQHPLTDCAHFETKPLTLYLLPGPWSDLAHLRHFNNIPHPDDRVLGPTGSAEGLDDVHAKINLVGKPPLLVAKGTQRQKRLSLGISGLASLLQVQFQKQVRLF